MLDRGTPDSFASFVLFMPHLAIDSTSQSVTICGWFCTRGPLVVGIGRRNILTRDPGKALLGPYCRPGDRVRPISNMADQRLPVMSRVPAWALNAMPLSTFSVGS